MGSLDEALLNHARSAARAMSVHIQEKTLDMYSVTATLYAEAKDLDNKGIIRVAETIRNRYDFYDKNKTDKTDKITYRDIVSAPGQYIGFNAYKCKTVKDFYDYEKGLTVEDRKKWERCKSIAR